MVLLYETLVNFCTGGPKRDADITSMCFMLQLLKEGGISGDHSEGCLEKFLKLFLWRFLEIY